MTAKTYRLLFVEDQLLEEPYLKLPFELSGFVVECATTGIEASEKLGRGRFDAIVLDNMVPGGGEDGSEWSMEVTDHCLRTGLLLLEEIAKMDQPPPVWVVTGLPDSEIERHAKSMVFVIDYIKKDYSLRQLAEAIYEHLERKEH